MVTGPDPYETPEPSGEPRCLGAAALKISTAALVALFFVPSACFAFSFFASLQLQNELLAKIALVLTLLGGILVSLFSAHVHTVREHARFGTLALLTFVYLLAQILALIILRFGLSIMTGY